MKLRINHHQQKNQIPITKSLRLSKIFFGQGNYDLALEFINEGLEVEPNNANLLELKKKIMEKK